jgi:hypothetical protein
MPFERFELGFQSGAQSLPAEFIDQAGFLQDLVALNSHLQALEKSASSNGPQGGC